MAKCVSFVRLLWFTFSSSTMSYATSVSRRHANYGVEFVSRVVDVEQSFVSP
jgi:hypothetical protein